jgi:hypothetical protein
LYRVNEHEYHEVGSAGPVESENLVEFYLLYAGPLHSSGSANPREEKHAIRKVFHSQLSQLWKSHPNLRERAIGIGQHLHPYVITELPPQEKLFQDGLHHLGSQWNRSGFNFVPLVTKQTCLRCSLDILFLRTDDLPFVLHEGGDIDRRLTILFDALRMADGNALPVGTEPDAEEDPFFVLLEDDKLISEVHVNTDRLLKLPDNKPLDQHDVYLQLDVRLNPMLNGPYAWIFG